MRIFLFSQYFYFLFVIIGIFFQENLSARSFSLEFNFSSEPVREFFEELELIRQSYNFSDEEWEGLLPLIYDPRGEFVLLEVEEESFYSLLSLYLRSCLLSMQESLLQQKIKKITVIKKLLTGNRPVRMAFAEYLLYLKKKISLPAYFQEEFFYLLHEALSGVARERIRYEHADYFLTREIYSTNTSKEPLFCEDSHVQDVVSIALSYADLRALKLAFFLKRYSGDQIIRYLKLMKKESYNIRNSYDIYLKVVSFLLAVYSEQSSRFDESDNFDYSASLYMVQMAQLVMPFQVFYSPRQRLIDGSDHSFCYDVARFISNDMLLSLECEALDFCDESSVISYTLFYGSDESISQLFLCYKKYRPHGCFSSLFNYVRGHNKRPLDILLERGFDEIAVHLIELLIELATCKRNLKNYFLNKNYTTQARSRGCFSAASAIEQFVF